MIELAGTVSARGDCQLRDCQDDKDGRVKYRSSSDGRERR